MLTLGGKLVKTLFQTYHGIELDSRFKLNDRVTNSFEKGVLSDESLDDSIYRPNCSTEMVQNGIITDSSPWL